MNGSNILKRLDRIEALEERSKFFLENGDNDLYNIPGTPPDLMDPPKGDAFALRSAYAMKIDHLAEPPMFKVSDTHYAATWLLHPLAPKIERPVNVGRKKVNINE